MATKVGISSPTKAILITKKENPVGFSFAATKVGISSPTKAILITKKENPVGFSFAYHLFVESYFRSASSVSVSDQVPSSLSKIS